MSKRKRTDFEDGIQNAAGTKYGADEAAETPISYDDEPDVNAPPTPPGPYSYTVEKRQKLHDLPNPTTKDHSPRPARKASSKPRVNPLFGQAGAFPEPSAQNSDEDDAADDEEAEQAWTYLLSVRAEAESLPSVYRVAAPTTTTAATDAPDSFIFSDGACIAAPRAEPASLLPRAQRAYYSALLGRFARHRERLVGKNATLGDEAECAKKLAAAEAPPVSAGGLETAAALRLLGRLDADVDAALTAGKGLPGHLGQWAWALLGALPRAGEMSSAEVGVVRDLAKRCAWGISWTRVAGDKVGEATTGFLEFVVTVVGEVWGQRDLLEGRAAWEV